MGRRLRGTLPLVMEELIPKWTYLEEFRRCDQVLKKKQKAAFDKRHRTRQLPTIPDDTEVWINSGEKPTRGRVTSHVDHPRSYLVETPTGIIRRNRFHLGIVPKQFSSAMEEDQQTSVPRKIMTRSQTGTEIRPPKKYPEKSQA